MLLNDKVAIVTGSASLKGQRSSQMKAQESPFWTLTRQGFHHAN
jgi:hypothetical protein